VVRGDDRAAVARNQGWLALQDRIADQFEQVSISEIAPYTGLEARKALGLYNILDSQYDVIEFERSLECQGELVP
jgi:hypothetical protein